MDVSLIKTADGSNSLYVKELDEHYQAWKAQKEA